MRESRTQVRAGGAHSHRPRRQRQWLADGRHRLRGLRAFMLAMNRAILGEQLSHADDRVERLHRDRDGRLQSGDVHHQSGKDGEASIAASSASQLRSQRRHASAQTRQCSWCSACRSHSSPHARQAAAQAWISARRTVDNGRGLARDDAARGAAGVSAVVVEANAADQLLHVRLAETGVGATGAHRGTVEALVDAAHERV